MTTRNIISKLSNSTEACCQYVSLVKRQNSFLSGFSDLLNFSKIENDFGKYLHEEDEKIDYINMFCDWKSVKQDFMKTAKKYDHTK